MTTTIYIWLAMLAFGRGLAGAMEQKPIDKLPSGVPNCQVVTTTVSECIRDAFNQMLKISKNGIPEINVPPIDPLEQERLKIEFSSEILRGKAIARRVKIYGLSDCTVNDLEYQRNASVFRMKMRLKCPHLELYSIYRAEMKVNNVKFSAKGDFNVTMTDVDTLSEQLAEEYQRDNQTFARVTKVNFYPNVGNLRLSASGLVPEPALNDALLEVLNQNWRPLADSALPAVHATLEPVLLNYANEVFSLIPLNLIFGDKAENQ